MFTNSDQCVSIGQATVQSCFFLIGYKVLILKLPLVSDDQSEYI